MKPPLPPGCCDLGRFEVGTLGEEARNEGSADNP